MKKRILSIFMAAVMAFSLAACSSGSSDDSDSSSTSASTETSTASSSSTTGEEEEVTISLMVTTRPTTDDKDFYLDWLPELIQEEYPYITIEVEQLPTDDYKQTVKLRFANGEGPDIFTWWSNKQAEDLVEAGYVRDLSDFSQMDKFADEIRTEYEFDGSTYAIPLGQSYLTTWYNVDMFEDAGITELPQNWEEFLECCQKLVDAGYTPITCGDKESYVIQYGIYQAGASVIYADNPDFDDQLYTGETSFTDDVWLETVEKFAELYENGYIIENSLGLSVEQSRQAFKDGQAAMIFDGSFGYDSLIADGAISFEKGMFALPTNDEGEDLVVNLTPSNGIFVSADSEKQDAIDKILEYWFTEGTPLFEKWVEESSDILCYEGTEDSRELVQEYLERYADNQKIYNLNNAWPEGVSDTLCSKFQEVITGTATAADVCQAMQDKFEELTE